MKNKTIPIVFITLGFFGNIGFNLIYALIMKTYNIDSGFIPFGVIGFIGLVVYLSALKSIRNNDKRIALGVFLIIFCGIIGGIFYLIWEPDTIADTVVTVNNNDGSVISTTEYVQMVEESDDPYQQLKKLRDLLDRGIIDKQTYDEKAKKYIKKL